MTAKHNTRRSTREVVNQHSKDVPTKAEMARHDIEIEFLDNKIQSLKNDLLQSAQAIRISDARIERMLIKQRGDQKEEREAVLEERSRRVALSFQHKRQQHELDLTKQLRADRRLGLVTWQKQWFQKVTITALVLMAMVLSALFVLVPGNFV